MCLLTYHEKPLVASKNIKVYKHVSVIADNKAQTPYQDTWFELNKYFVAQPSYTHLSRRAENRWEINGGAIHACMWPDFSRGKCLETYIPEGTKYWYGVDKSTICAKKLYITDKEVKPEDCAGLDEEIATSVYSEAPTNNEGVKIGSFSVFGDFVSPSIAVSVSKKDIKGIVVGFNGDEPVVADIQNLLECVYIDSNYNSKFHQHFPYKEDAMKDMNGYEHTKAWKETCEGDSHRYKAYDAVTKLGEHYYIPALGEMELVWANLIYIATGCSIAHIICPFTMQGWYWTSTEFSQSCSWYSGLYSYGTDRYWDSKHLQFSVVPFVASAHLKKK